MKRVKKAKTRRPRYEVSDKQIQRIKKEVSEEATKKACLLCIGVMADDLELNEDQICEIAKSITRYASYLDDHVVSLNEIAGVIENRTGISFGRF